MTYKEFIENIKNTRGQWCEEITKDYWEPHHIIPLCKNGEPADYNKRTKQQHENIIFLTFSEHVEAHKLLYIENPHDADLANAYHCLIHMNGNYDATIEELELARKAAGENSKQRKPLLGKHKYTNGKDTIFCFEGDQPEGYVLGADENWSNNISKALLGKKMSKDDPRRDVRRDYMKQQHYTLGKIQINNGKIHKFINPDELDAYIAEGWVKGQIPFSEETRNKLSEKAKERERRKKEKRLCQQ